jgi:hypothetical protein
MRHTYVSGRKRRPVANITAGMHWMRMAPRHAQYFPASEVQNVMAYPVLKHVRRAHFNGVCTQYYAP